MSSACSPHRIAASEPAQARPDEWPTPDGVRLFAHRGSSAHLPENTLDAFRQGLTEGANALELDVHRTRDGHFVVCHDRCGTRMAGVPTQVSQASLREVKSWDVGKEFGDVGKVFRMPTLEEVLSEFRGTPLSVDIKPAEPAAVPAILNVLAAHGAEQWVTLASFHDRQVRRVRELGYGGPTALSRREVLAVRVLPLPWARPWVRGTAAQVPRKAGGLRFDDRRFIGRCRRLGLRIDFWVVNDGAEAVELVRRGATGVMTDDPRRIAAALAGVSVL